MKGKGDTEPNRDDAELDLMLLFIRVPFFVRVVQKQGKMVLGEIGKARFFAAPSLTLISLESSLTEKTTGASNSAIGLHECLETGRGAREE